MGLFNVINASQKKYDGKVESIIYENCDFMEKSGKNIYFFIVDAMPPIDVDTILLKTYSSIFLDDLSRKDYIYVPNTKWFYWNTTLSVGFIFNMNKVLIENSNSTFPTIMKKKNLSNLEFNLQKLNYDIKWIGSHFANCNGYNKE